MFQVLRPLRPAERVGKYEIGIALRASQLPFLQGVHGRGRERDVAFACRALGRICLAPGVDPLPDVSHASGEINAFTSCFDGKSEPGRNGPLLARRLSVATLAGVATF